MEESQNPTSQVTDPAPPVAPVQAPENLPAQKPKSKLLIALIVGIFLFLLIAGSAAGFYVYKQSVKPVTKTTPVPVISKTISTPTANWKTYNNTVDGYSIKYPSNLFTNCSSIDNSFTLFLGKDDIKNCNKGEQTTEFGITNSLSGTGSIATSYYPKCYSVKTENTTIAGVPAKKYSNVILNDTGTCNNQYVNGEKNNIHIIFTKNNVSYNIFYYEDENKSVKEQILSTFKFTDQQLPPGGQFSTVGESCGPNAGAAGDAQCAYGLDCKYQTDQQKLNGIGICVKN